MTSNEIRVSTRSRHRRVGPHLVATLSLITAWQWAAGVQAAVADMPAVSAPAQPEIPALAPSPPPPPYSLPWQLRPITVGTVLRSDTTVATYKNGEASGNTVATTLLGSYKLTPEFAPMVRLGFVKNDAPGAAANGSSFVNPIVGLTYARKMGTLKWAVFGATSIPVGMGAGNTPDAGTAAANAAGISARSAMDNAMFAVNYMTPIVGAAMAYVDRKFTAQLEATTLFLLRVRGDAAPSATDSTRVNATAGLHLGYFVIPQISIGAELRYQRWLTTPTRLLMGSKVSIPTANKDTLTVAIGPRGNFKIGNGMWIRPGISYGRGLDDPMSAGSYSVIQIDVPVVF